MRRRGRLYQSAKIILRRSRPTLWFVGAILLWATSLYLLTSTTFPKVFVKINKASVERSALIGDTFGIVSALMASLAAVGAVLALSEQRVAVKRQMFIATFVGMMDRLQQTVQDTDYLIVQQVPIGGDLVEERLQVSQSGQNAFAEFAQELRLFIQKTKPRGIPAQAYEGLVVGLYESFYNDYKDELGHYFRQLYHILLYIDQSDEEDKDRFAKLLRASCTNSQLLLLAYNAIGGEGRIKFASLISKYSMLHNLGFEIDELGRIERRLIIDRLGPAAIESESQSLDKSTDEFKAREAKNIAAKQACYEYLLGHNLDTDLGVSWVRNHVTQ